MTSGKGTPPHPGKEVPEEVEGKVVPGMDMARGQGGTAASTPIWQ